MNIKKMIALFSILLLPLSVTAQSYRAEVGAELWQVSYDFGSAAYDLDAIGFEGTFHLQELEAQNVPMAEWAYVAKSNNVSVKHTILDFAGGDTVYDIARLEWYFTEQKIYAAPFFLYTDTDSSNYWGISLGGTPIEGLRVFTTLIEGVEYDLNVFAKYLMTLKNGKMLSIEGGLEMDASEDLDGTTDYFGAAVDYYLDSTWSIGGFYHNSSNLNSFFMQGNYFLGDSSIGLRSTKFVTDELCVNGSIAMGDEVDSLKIGIDFRF